MDCVVCTKHKHKRVKGEQEKEQTTGKRRCTEELGKVHVEDTKKVDEQKEEEEKLKEKRQLKEEECAESEMGEERGETSRPAQEIRCNERRQKHKEEVNIEMGVGVAKRLTAYYCKTCPGRPALCPAPCFELYHTKLLYRFITEPEHHTQPDGLVN